MMHDKKESFLGMLYWIEWMVNDTPAQNIDRLLGVRNRVCKPNLTVTAHIAFDEISSN